MSLVLYNEHDPFAADWLRELIAADLIAPGVVDERSIEDVRPDELSGYAQCHFFAGIGIWSLALRRAGWPDDRPIWTGSCPCQPFSQAGQGRGFADERHLWPAWQWLIQQCRPPALAGEQVAGKDVDPWVDLVQADLEGLGYAFGCVPFPAAGVGAPHIRDRTYWMAYADDRQCDRVADGERRKPDRSTAGRIEGDCITAAGGVIRRLADADGWHASTEGLQCSGEQRQQPQDGGIGHNRGPGAVNGVWRDADWLRCRDEKWRPVEPGTFPLVDAGTFRNRVGLLRGAGNAITLGQAEEFASIMMASIPDRLAA